MSDQIFYVGAEDDENLLTGYVASKFLMRNGIYAMNPTPGGSQQAYLYSDSSGSNKTNGSIANPNNYLIVPANYSEHLARDFAGEIANTLRPTFPEDELGKAGIYQTLGQMIAAFLPGGSQDLQRHPQWGIPKGSIAPAFIGSASNHLGFVTALAGLPKIWSEIGGGAANTINADVIQPARRLVGRRATSIDASGPYGLSPQNYTNISQGYSDGLMAGKPPSPFNGYGYGPQSQSSVGQIGDGIAGWMSSLAGVDPQEPPPPAWPPQAIRPIRYLGRWTQ